MRSKLLVCLLLTALVSGQTPPAAPAPAAGQSTPPAAGAAPAPPTKAPETPETKVNPDDTVITIKGFCADANLQGDACKTTITRAQFEKLADALQPNMSPPMRRQLATAYSRMLTLSTEAEKRSLDKQPHFDEAIHFARMQILSQELSRALQAESTKISDEEIQEYYQKNLPNYEQATFARIFVPHTKRNDRPAPPRKITAAGAADAKGAAKTAAPAAKKLSPEEEEKLGVEAMTKEAALLRARAAKGEDPDKLQKAAFVAGGLMGNPPPTKMEKARRPSLPASHVAVMDLKPGEVSPVINDPSGNYIYKMISKTTMPVDSVKTEIRNQISSQRYRDAMQKYQGSADLNENYFGPTRVPGMPLPPRGGRPTAEPENDPD
jgi:hypothetical protein